jgi:hypothetical protein
MHIPVRLAEVRDVPLLSELIAASVRGLQAGDYSTVQLEHALRTVYGVDTQLISDGTYFAAEEMESSGAPLLVGCGGWSKRRTLYGGDQFAGREDSVITSEIGRPFASSLRSLVVLGPRPRSLN